MTTVTNTVPVIFFPITVSQRRPITTLDRTQLSHLIDRLVGSRNTACWAGSGPHWAISNTLMMTKHQYWGMWSFDIGRFISTIIGISLFQGSC
jgi:hypothetical protein